MAIHLGWKTERGGGGCVWPAVPISLRLMWLRPSEREKERDGRGEREARVWNQVRQSWGAVTGFPFTDTHTYIHLHMYFMLTKEWEVHSLLMLCTKTSANEHEHTRVHTHRVSHPGLGMNRLPFYGILPQSLLFKLFCTSATQSLGTLGKIGRPQCFVLFFPCNW